MGMRGVGRIGGIKGIRNKRDISVNGEYFYVRGVRGIQSVKGSRYIKGT